MHFNTKSSLEGIRLCFPIESESVGIAVSKTHAQMQVSKAFGLRRQSRAVSVAICVQKGKPCSGFAEMSTFKKLF